jgi:hypothetical protein
VTAIDATRDDTAEKSTSTPQGLKRFVPRERPSLVWWHELLIIALGYFVYTAIRNGVPTREALAQTRAHQVINFEKSLHIFGELHVNHFLFNHVRLAEICNYDYATLHFIVTIGVGVWLFARHQAQARALRTAWYLTNLMALIGYEFFPLAPPRLVKGYSFHDTVLAFHTWGHYGDVSTTSASNQFAAMPSMHIGWSLWCAVVIVKLAKRNWVKVLGALYPVTTLFVIVGTANHYFSDAIGGVVALAAGFCIARLFNGRWAFTPDPRVVEKAQTA